MLKTLYPVLHSLAARSGLAVSTFGSWFAGRLCLRVGTAVCIADLSVGYMHDPPQGIMGGV